MRKKKYEFSIYRLQRYDEPGQLPGIDNAIPDDENIISVIKKSCQSKFDVPDETKQTKYKWAIRRFAEYSHKDITSSKIAGITLTRSEITKYGDIVTSKDIISGQSEAEPPLADTLLSMFIYLERHIVTVEYNSRIMRSDTWKKKFNRIVSLAANSLGFTTSLFLEPIPKEEEILSVFKSFQKLTRLKIKLVLPNPDMSRYTKHLHEELLDNEIREYEQDMKNPEGISQVEGKRPHASATMAEMGYKRGRVNMSGFINGKYTKKTIGERAARGTIDILKDTVKHIWNNPKSFEATEIVKSIFEEVKKLIRPGD